MPLVHDSITVSYDVSQETLSALLAVSVSYVFLGVSARMTAAPYRTRVAWMMGGAMAIGMGIWATQCVAILAVGLPIPTSDHWPTSLASLLVDIFFSGSVLYAVSRPIMGSGQVAITCLILGAGFTTVDYSAMANLQLVAARFDPIMVAASIALALLLALAALLLSFQFRNDSKGSTLKKLGGAILLGTMMLAMHHTGFAAVGSWPWPGLPNLSQTTSASAPGPLGPAIAIATFVVLGLTLLTCELDRAAGSRTEQLERGIVERTRQLMATNEHLEESEAAANARAAELAGVLDAVPGMVFIARDRDCTTITGSRVTYESLHLPFGVNVSKTALEGAVGLGFRVMREGLELSASQLPLQQAAATGQEVRDCETTWIFQDGTSRDTLGNAVPLRDKTGDVRGAVGVFIDITARNRAQQALRESEDRYRDLIEHSRDLVCTHDLFGKLLSCNPEPARILGYEVDELLNIPMLDLMSRESREQFAGYLTRIQTIGVDEGEVSVVTRSGEQRIWEYRNTLRTEGVPAPIVRGMAHDITERQRAEKSLRLFRLLIDQCNDSVEVVDPETFRFIDINERACSQLGYSRDEMLTMSVYDIDPSIKESMHAMSLDRLQTSASAVFQSRHRRKDGSNFPVEVSVKRVQLERTYIVAVARDITERKRAELDLQELRSELGRMARFATVGELTATIAHEVNQPLTAAVIDSGAALHWLGLDSPNLDEARAAVKRAMAEAGHASAVIETIRALLQKAPTQRRMLDANEVIRQTILLVEGDLEKNGIVLQTELEQDIPAVLGDRIQLQQVMLNLMLNAIDGMNAISGRRRELFVRSSKHAEGVLIQVQDSGSGFDPALADRIFEPFFSTKPGGFGLGLSISRSIVESLGGRLWAARGDVHGAIFQFTLPEQAGLP